VLISESAQSSTNFPDRSKAEKPEGVVATMKLLDPMPAREPLAINPGLTKVEAEAANPKVKKTVKGAKS